jgi:hypothetical protein
MLDCMPNGEYMSLCRTVTAAMNLLDPETGTEVITRMKRLIRGEGGRSERENKYGESLSAWRTASLERLGISAEGCGDGPPQRAECP